MLGEFQTLVNPGAPIPPFITVLTGITDAMVADGAADRARCCRRSWSSPAATRAGRPQRAVRHRLPQGGLRRGTATPWPRARVLDTAALARRVLTRDEVPNCKLATPGPAASGPRTTPNHRALADARATVDVLHGADRAARQPRGAHARGAVDVLRAGLRRPARASGTWPRPCPHAPGRLPVPRRARRRPLYVGTSKDLRTRVRTYFTAGETRGRMAEMVGARRAGRRRSCARHALEAEVRELRLIAAHKPRYNRRSRFPERAHWLKLTAEAFPRLSLVREVRDDGAAYLGPFSGTAARPSWPAAAVHEAFRLRQCTPRLSPRTVSAACALAEMGRCARALRAAGITVEAYAEHVAAVPVRDRSATSGRSSTPFDPQGRPARRRPSATRRRRRAPRPAGGVRCGPPLGCSGCPR